MYMVYIYNIRNKESNQGRRQSFTAQTTNQIFYFSPLILKIFYVHGIHLKNEESNLERYECLIAYIISAH